MLKILTLVSAALLVSGCGNKVPECASKEAITTLEGIVLEVINKPDAKERLVISAPETVAKNENLKRNSCMANVEWKLHADTLQAISDLDAVEPIAAFVSGFLGGNPMSILSGAQNVKPIDPEIMGRLKELWVGLNLN